MRRRRARQIFTRFPGVKQPLRDALEDLADQGAEITLTGSGHYRIRHPHLPRDLIVSSTPRNPDIATKKIRTAFRHL